MKKSQRKGKAGCARKRKNAEPVFDAFAEAAKKARGKEKEDQAEGADRRAASSQGNTPVAVVPPSSSNNNSARSTFDLTSDHKRSSQVRSEDSVVMDVTKTNESERGIGANGTGALQQPSITSLILASERRIVEEVKKNSGAMCRNLEKKLSKLQSDVNGFAQRINSLEKVSLELKGGVKHMNQAVDGSIVSNQRTLKEEDNEKLFMDFHKIFDKVVLVNATERCLIGRTVLIIDNSLEFKFTERVALSIQAMMFSRLPGYGKDIFQTKSGKEYCSLRRSIVVTALLNAVKDSFNRFKTTPITSTSSGTVVAIAGSIPIRPRGRESKTKIERPFWCMPNFIEKAHINAVQVRLEKLQSQNKDTKSKSKASNSDTDDEIPSVIAMKVFQTVTSWLTKARERSKKVFFDELGFLFSHWGSFGVSLDQNSLEFIWGSHESEDGFDYTIVPEARVVKEGDDVESVMRSNMLAWKDMLDRNRQFVLLTAYTVAIRADKEKPSEHEVDDSDTQSASKYFSAKEGNPDNVLKIADPGQSGDIRVVYRAFNLLDVGLQFISSYSGHRTNGVVYEILASSKNSFRCVYAIASLFKDLVGILIDDFNTSGPSIFKEGGHTKGEEVFGINLQSLFPSQSKMTASLCTSCLCMTADEYKDDCLEDSIKARFRCYQEAMNKAKRDSRKQIGTTGDDSGSSDDEQSILGDDDPPLQLAEDDDDQYKFGDEDDFTS